jgi:uncharacterized Zn finger protein (UPF0148 family)
MKMFADNPDFYPTPRIIARKMLAKITNNEAKYFLEPSAGKGDIADVIKQPLNYEEFCEENPDYTTKDHRRYNGPRWSDRNENPRVHVDVVESYPALIQVLRGKEYDVVGFDWLSYEGVSYYDCIIANPPFSEGAKHCLKMWGFLHNGEIVCLLNEETLKNPHTDERQRLARIIEQFGTVEYLGDCFSTAEHKTSVNVAMVYLKKVAPDDSQDLWGKQTTQEKNFNAEFDGDVQMLAIRDNLGNMEHWFNMANEHWMKGIEHIRKAKFLMDQNKISEYSSRSNGGDDTKTILAMALSNVQTCRAEFLRSHRRRAWTSVFEQMEFGRWLDSKQQESFMRDVQRDSTIPFTANNIRATLDNVFMSRKKLFEESVARVFDDLCGHAVDNGSGPIDPHKAHWNRHGRNGAEGWKTNDNYKVNQKLIFPNGIGFSHGSFSTYSGASAGTIYSDLDRILCVLDGQSLKDCYTVGAALDRASRGAKTGGTFESEYFTGRFYKKGTVHLKWKREDLWERFNLEAAAGKKWLGEDTQQYRPTKRKTGADIPWQCREEHSFVNGVCERCDEPEVGEVEAVACEWCRAIFEHTGEISCPMHEIHSNELDLSNTLLLTP